MYSTVLLLLMISPQVSMVVVDLVIRSRLIKDLLHSLICFCLLPLTVSMSVCVCVCLSVCLCVSKWLYDLALCASFIYSFQ